MLLILRWWFEIMIAFMHVTIIFNLILILFIIWMCRRMYVFSSPDPKSHVSFCLHLEYVFRLSSLYFYKKILKVCASSLKLSKIWRRLVIIFNFDHPRHTFQNCSTIYRTNNVGKMGSTSPEMNLVNHHNVSFYRIYP
jgi:hypothetical protein